MPYQTTLTFQNRNWKPEGRSDLHTITDCCWQSGSGVWVSWSKPSSDCIDCDTRVPGPRILSHILHQEMEEIGKCAGSSTCSAGEMPHGCSTHLCHILTYNNQPNWLLEKVTNAFSNVTGKFAQGASLDLKNVLSKDWWRERREKKERWILQKSPSKLRMTGPVEESTIRHSAFSGRISKRNYVLGKCVWSGDIRILRNQSPRAVEKDKHILFGNWPPQLAGPPTENKSWAWPFLLFYVNVFFSKVRKFE